MIEKYKPVWNEALKGLGNHAPLAVVEPDKRDRKGIQFIQGGHGLNDLQIITKTR